MPQNTWNLELKKTEEEFRRQMGRERAVADRRVSDALQGFGGRSSRSATATTNTSAVAASSSNGKNKKKAAAPASCKKADDKVGPSDES